MWNLIPWKKNQQPSNTTLTTEPFEREFSRIRDDFDRLLHSMWSGAPMFDRSLDRLFDQRWGLDVEDTDTHYVARMEAPGFEVDDFDVQTIGNQLVVKAEHKESQNGKNGSSYRYGRLHRSIPLPDGAEPDQVEARYHSGVLELQIPKGKESQHTKRIAVKAA
jgi:HSP20 family molecular chaperone IbpA